MGFYKVISGVLMIVLIFMTGCSPKEDMDIANNIPDKAVSETETITGTTTSKIFIKTKTDGTDDGFEKLIELMNQGDVSFYKLISKDDVVLIKINCQWDERGGTNTDLIKSMIKAILNHPDGFTGEIIVADNGQKQFGPNRTGGSMDWTNNNAQDKTQSVQKVVEEFSNEYKVSAYLWDEITTTEVKEYSEGDYTDGFVVYPELETTGAPITYPKFKTRYGTYISFKEGIWNEETKTYTKNKLKVINTPVLKDHMIYFVTGAVKHYLGTASDKLSQRAVHNSVGNGFMGTQLAKTRMPILNVLDCIYINPVRGPMTSYNAAVQKNMILASTDPVALDYYASKNILMPAAKEIGNSRYDTMDPDGTDPGTFGYWLRLSAEELVKAGYPVTMDEEKIEVFEE